MHIVDEGGGWARESVKLELNFKIVLTGLIRSSIQSVDPSQDRWFLNSQLPFSPSIDGSPQRLHPWVH